MANNEAKFSLNLESNAADVADDATGALEKLRQQIHGSENSIKEYAGTLRRLRGNTDEVKSAKEQLKAKIDAERAAISAANLQLLKAGTNYEHLAAKQKKAAIEAENLKKKMDAEKAKSLNAVISASGGPVSQLRDKLAGLKEMLAGTDGAMSLASLAAVGFVAAMAALVVAIGAAAIALGRFIIAGANTARSMNLVREAAAGSAENARALGTQVDALSQKLPTSKAALNELAASLAKGGVQGQTLVDTLNAVGQASAALGDDAGNKLREFIDRGRLTQRFMVNPLELQGTGLQFDDIAKELATSMKVGIKDARAALFEGRVKLGDGAAAMRAAVEKKFGSINLRKMMSLEVISQKFKETLDSLTDGVNLEPLLRGLQKLAGIFDESTMTGWALKQGITAIGNAIGTTFEAVVPYAIQFIKGLIIAGLDIAIAFYKVKNALKGAFGDSKFFKDIDGLKVALIAGRALIYGMATGLLLFATVVTAAIAPFVLFGIRVVETFTSIYDAGKKAYDWLAGLNWSSIGVAIADGLVTGLSNGKKQLVDAVMGMGDSVKQSFKKSLGIASPSKVFAEFGRNTTKGYSEGVEDGASEASSSVSAMVQVPKAPSGGQAQGKGSGRGDVVVHVHIHPTANGDVAKQVTDPTVLAQFQQILENALLAGGLPTT